MERESKLFVIETGTDLKFICNAENGQWVLSDEEDLSKIEPQIKKNTLSKKVGSGTSMVLMNLGRPCNLSCLYCHISEEKTGELMSIETAKKSIDKILELSEKDRTVIFHGSEPLLNFSVLKETVKYGKSKGINSFGIQTNGTLIDKEKLDFFSDYGVGVGISLDGLRKHQDATRNYVCGKSSYDVIVDNIKRTIDKLGGVFVITVVSEKNVNDLEEITEDFEKRGIGAVRFSPLYPTNNSQDITPKVDEFKRNMINVFDRYLRNLYIGKKTIKISNFQETLRNIFSPKETLNCVKCSGGIRQPLMGIDISGEIYPCDFFWGRKDYLTGDIYRDSISEAISSDKNFRNTRKIDSLEDCTKCNWKTFCGAGCPGGSVIGGNGISSKDYYCDYNKTILGYVASKIPKLHEKNLINSVLGV